MSVKVNFVGRLGANAEVVTSKATQFISFRVAVHDRIKSEDVTTWMHVNGDFGKYKNIVEYLRQGSFVYVSGTEICTLYNAKDGTTGIDRKVRADAIEFVNVGPKKEGQATTTTDESATNVNASPVVQAPIQTETIAQDVMTTGTLRGKKDDGPMVPVSATATVSEEELPF